ncbi:hypothetical protein PV326_008874 [Microctonus aethiopoides]|uniref:RecF/RecN/SMC N-terminal domain-containing protein n=1 Tax=Microctonus aethiopoides TaxID=144406 RepID=A0AA39FIQ7_9HYME|nr:hypothetical protein PV326_008874 [Microctonus aethiopoides]KAK0170283.1 hypothetical protein PV328_010862 [Microctonus aethiopoides]
MGSQVNSRKSKRKSPFIEKSQDAKKSRSSDEDEINPRENETAGKITRIVLRNIMCHDALEINLNKNVNFIVGKNGSGKSAILAGLAVGLGARAQVTSRATAVNGIIKDKCARGIIEITLTNVGPLAYKRETYGDTITVVRTLGTTSNYKIKNAIGHIISTKKSELDRIIGCMNIQVDNPISVLNQEQSREFITTSNSSKKYILFMKATQLDIIGENYRQAMIISSDTKRHLDNTSEQLKSEQNEIESLEEKLRMLKSLDETRKELDALQIELLWSFAIAEEDKLKSYEDKLSRYREVYEEEKSSQSDHGTKVEKIETELDNLKSNIQESEINSQSLNEAYTIAKRKHSSKVEEVNSAQRQSRALQNELKHLQQDILLLTNEIKRLESGNSDAEHERNQQKQRLAKMKEELREVEAMLNTNQIQQNHLESEKVYLDNESRSCKMEIDSQMTKINKLKHRLNGMKQQSGDALTVFGRNIPRLLKRIDEEYAKKRFKEKPCGPLGAYIKMKDPTWTPAVESFLGYGILTGFCVDNAQDARVLSSIIKEIYIDESSPSITCSKFHHRVHNVSGKNTGTSEFMSLLDAMEITNPIVANCLIDQREPECILLIPTSADAKRIMGNRQNVPQNCRRALTKKGDLFFPDPRYRCYSNKVAQRAKWLQVSTRDAILSLQEDIQVAENDLNRLMQDHKTSREKLLRNSNDYNESHQKVVQLAAMKSKLKIKIEQINDTIMEETNDNCEVFKKEKIEKEKQIEIEQAKEKKLRDEIQHFDDELKQLETEVHRCRKLLNDHNEKINVFKVKIRDLENEKRELELNAGYTKRRLEDAQCAYKNELNVVEKQKETTTEVVKRAEQAGPRINTERSPGEINRLSKTLQVRIRTVQEEYGSEGELQAELEHRQAKSQEVMEKFNILSTTNVKHLSRVQNRRKEFQQMKSMMAAKVKQAFANVLALRNYDGNINIDHANKKLDIEVYPQNARRKDANDVQTLSGGEKSYSTVAFILALWECTTLPFYFLDEFDVFMDKVNRRVIMDILIEHTKEHPERQFGFLTPLDASIVVADEYLTIHRLAAPERTGNTQDS